MNIGGSFTINSQGVATKKLPTKSGGFVFEPPSRKNGPDSSFSTVNNNQPDSTFNGMPSISEDNETPFTTPSASSNLLPTADSHRLNELLSSLRMTDGPEAVLRELKIQMEKFKKLSVNPEDAAAAYDQAVKHLTRFASRVLRRKISRPVYSMVVVLI
jgi:hypothetical protein